DLRRQRGRRHQGPGAGLHPGRARLDEGEERDGPAGAALHLRAAAQRRRRQLGPGHAGSAHRHRQGLLHRELPRRHPQGDAPGGRDVVPQGPPARTPLPRRRRRPLPAADGRADVHGHRRARTHLIEGSDRGPGPPYLPRRAVPGPFPSPHRPTRLWEHPMRVLASLALVASVALPATPVHAAEPTPVCVGYDVLEISPGLSAEPTTGTVNHVGPLGQETCHGGDPLGYKATGPIGIEHYITYRGTCTNPVLKGYALHHIPTADG